MLVKLLRLSAYFLGIAALGFLCAFSFNIGKAQRPVAPADPGESELDKAKRILQQRKTYMQKATIPLSISEKDGAQRLELATILETMKFVGDRVSSLNYGFQYLAGQKHPESNEEALRSGAGLCGNHAAVFLELVRSLGYQAQSVQFYYPSNKGIPYSHIAAEVKLGGRWVFTDITNQALFRNAKYKFQPLQASQLLSQEEVSNIGIENVDIVQNSIDGFKYFWEPANSRVRWGSFDYLFSTKTQGGILHGGNGKLVPFSAKVDGDRIIMTHDGIQNFLGQGQDHGVDDIDGAGVELVLPNIPGGDSVNVQFANIACNRIEPFRLKVYDNESGQLYGYVDKDNTRITIPGQKATTSVAIGLDGPGHWEIPNGRACYAIWNSVTVSAN